MNLEQEHNGIKQIALKIFLPGLYSFILLYFSIVHILSTMPGLLRVQGHRYRIGFSRFTIKALLVHIGVEIILQFASLFMFYDEFICLKQSLRVNNSLIWKTVDIIKSFIIIIYYLLYQYLLVQHSSCFPQKKIIFMKIYF